MRASELIGSSVVDGRGRDMGIIRDLRVDVGGLESGGFRIAGLVLSRRGARAAASHGWGFAEGRAKGPAIFRRVLAPAVEESSYVRADRVLDWGPGPVRVAEGAAVPLREAADLP